MEPKQIALYCMAGTGALFIIGAFIVALRRPGEGAKDPWWKPVFMGVMGVALLGVTAFGPSFLGSWGKFLTELASVVPQERREVYRTAINDIASGRMPPEYRPLVAAYMLQNPAPDMEELFEEGILKAQGAPKELLSATKADLLRKQELADLAARNVAAVSPEGATGAALERLDNTTLRILETREATLRELKIDRSAVEEVLRKRIRTSGTNK